MLVRSNFVCGEWEAKHYYLYADYMNIAGVQASSAPEHISSILYNNEEKKIGPTKK